MVEPSACNRLPVVEITVVQKLHQGKNSLIAYMGFRHQSKSNISPKNDFFL